MVGVFVSDKTDRRRFVQRILPVPCLHFLLKMGNGTIGKSGLLALSHVEVDSENERGGATIHHHSTVDRIVPDMTLSMIRAISIRVLNRRGTAHGVHG